MCMMDIPPIISVFQLGVNSLHDAHLIIEINTKLHNCAAKQLIVICLGAHTTRTDCCVFLSYYFDFDNVISFTLKHT